MMRLVLLILVFLPFVSIAQQRETTLNSVLQNGKFSAHGRAFFMSTINEGDLTDYYALAVGAGIGYESPEFKKWKIGISGFFIYNVLSSDLSKSDPLSNMWNRYEVALFDITDPKNGKDLDRLEELYIQYRIHGSFLRAGNMILNTPFINSQDGRMRPNLEQGIWAEINEIKTIAIQAGWITAVSPRSTVKWYSVGESIGIYPAGFDESGARSDYAGNLHSKGIGMVGVTYKKNLLKLSLWNTLVENISNTAFVEAEKDFPAADQTYYAGLQAVRQDAIGPGGSEIVSQTYIRPGTFSNIVSGRAGIRNKNIDFNINATFFSNTGRYLMPREWGRDPFYTFLPRERNEGVGGVKAYSVNFAYTSPVKKVKVGIGLGRYELPDVTNYSLNKYAMPSYIQLNSDVRYDFSGFLRDASLQFLYVYKKGTGKDYEIARNVMNKVNMSNFSLVFNYRFEGHHSVSKK